MFNNYTPSDSEEEVSDNSSLNLPFLNINSMSLQSPQHTSATFPDKVMTRSGGGRQFPSSFSPERMTTTSPVFMRHFPSPTRTRCSSPPKPPKPEKKTRVASRLSASTERIRRQLDFPPDDHQEFSILRLLPVIKKGDPHQDKPHASELEFLASQQTAKQKASCVITNSTPSPLQLAKGLTKSQLVDLLTSLTEANPTLSTSLAKLMPKPDLSGLITNLTYLNQNIYKAIPVTRLSDRRDSLAYSRVATHLAAFKKSVVEDLKMLLEAGQWASVLEYVILAWDIVRVTPLWDNPVHNTSRSSCFKDMASSVLRVLKIRGFLIAEDSRMKLVTCMTGFSVREVELCREKLLEAGR